MWNAAFAALGVGVGALVPNLIAAIAAALAWLALVEGRGGAADRRRGEPVAAVRGRQRAGPAADRGGRARRSGARRSTLVGYAALVAVAAPLVTDRRDIV